MSDFPTTEAFQGFIYAALTVTSLGVLGMVGELCDIQNDCPARPAAVIAFAVLVFLLSLPMFAAYAFEISFLKRIEIFLVIGILIFNIVETGIASSPRTIRLGGDTTARIVSFIVELTWWGLLLAFAAFFLALSSGDRPRFEVSLKKDDTEAGTQPVAAGYGTQDATTVPSQPTQPSYTAPPPQPGAVNYTTPPPATK